VDGIVALITKRHKVWLPFPFAINKVFTQRKVGSVSYFVDVMNAGRFRVFPFLQALLALVVKVVHYCRPKFFPIFRPIKLFYFVRRYQLPYVFGKRYVLWYSHSVISSG
jgi:hypothetical protein